METPSQQQRPPVLYAYPETRTGQLLRDLVCGPSFYVLFPLLLVVCYYEFDLLVTVCVGFVVAATFLNWPHFYPKRFEIEEHHVRLVRYWRKPIICSSMSSIGALRKIRLPIMNSYGVTFFEAETGRLRWVACPPSARLKRELDEFIERVDRRFLSELSQ